MREVRVFCCGMFHALTLTSSGMQNVLEHLGTSDTTDFFSHTRISKIRIILRLFFSICTHSLPFGRKCISYQSVSPSAPSTLRVRPQAPNDDQPSVSDGLSHSSKILTYVKLDSRHIKRTQLNYERAPALSQARQLFSYHHVHHP